MAIVYFDASALVKLLIEEDGSDMVANLWDGCDAAISSRLAHPEVCAALAASRRNGDLDERGYDESQRAWGEYWPAMRRVELTAEVERLAGDLTSTRALRGADAVHLASALAVGIEHVVMAVWDRRLHEAAMAEGLAVAPSGLPN